MRAHRFLLLTLITTSQIINAQEHVAQSGLSELANNSPLTKGMASAALYIGGAVLAVGLIGLIYSIANNKPHAKEYLISWLIAVFFYIMLLAF